MDEKVVKYVLTPEEIEKMLEKKFSGKLQPVDTSKEAIHQQQHAYVAGYVNKFCNKQ